MKKMSIEQMIAEKKSVMVALEIVMEFINRKQEACLSYWGKTGEKEQKYHWDSEFKERVYEFDDNDEPIMIDSYGTIQADTIEHDEICEEDKIMYKGLEILKDKLCDLL